VASRRDAAAGHVITSVLVVALVVLAVVLLLAVAGGLALSSASLRDLLIAPRGATSAIASHPSAPTPERTSNAMAHPATSPAIT
jgi:flagellar basal body-associated protein FliL